ncbi:hypothetical protein Pan97_13750 [Bremerella volcania]|uniref:Uncharacterized protein n=1 Tax=Bremerella volcania TaxID=2527984 RepID=A0A518C570_9BACT|nr:hypothetical protein [Bremerella volcania]QDU74368.1 hypothetical protein Pan97_13750 [Bremerella volcania]
MFKLYVLVLAASSFSISLLLSTILPAQPPVDEKKVISIPLDPLAEAKKDGDLLAWIHFGSVKFGGTDPLYQLRVLKDGTAIAPKDYRQRESRLKLADEEIKTLRKTLLKEIAIEQIAGPWFNSKPNRWDGSQDCYLVRDDQKVITLTCEYGWPSATANQDLMIRQYLDVMQTYTDLIQLVRAGGKEAVARQLPLANEGLKKYSPESAPFSIEDFTFGEDFPDGHRRLTFLREKKLEKDQWEKVRVEVLVPDEGKPRLGDVTINGKRHKS